MLYGQASPSEALAAAQLDLSPLDLDAFLREVAANAAYAGIDDVRYDCPASAAARARRPVLAGGRRDAHPAQRATGIARRARRSRCRCARDGRQALVLGSTTPAPRRRSRCSTRIFDYGVSDGRRRQRPARARPVRRRPTWRRWAAASRQQRGRRRGVRARAAAARLSPLAGARCASLAWDGADSPAVAAAGRAGGLQPARARACTAPKPAPPSTHHGAASASAASAPLPTRSATRCCSNAGAASTART